MSLRQNTFLKIIALAVLVLASSILFAGPDASAQSLIPTDPQTVPGNEVPFGPGSLYENLKTCNVNGQPYGGTGGNYLSFSGKSGAVSSITLPAGTLPTDPVHLVFHVISTTCFASNDVKSARILVDSNFFPANGISNFGGGLEIDRGTWTAAPPAAVPGETHWRTRTFDFKPPTGKFTADGTPYTYTVQLHTVPMNQKSSGQYFCVNNSAQRPGWDYNCGPSGENSTSATISVTIPASAASISGEKVGPDGTIAKAGPGASDTITLTCRDTPCAPRPDSANPFGARWNNLKPENFTVTAANSKAPGYVVVGSAWCDTTANAACDPTFYNSPETYPGAPVEGSPGLHGQFVPGTARPIGKLIGGHKYVFRWVYKQAGAPDVQMSCAGSGTTYTITGYAKDPDKAAKLSVQFYVGGVLKSTQSTDASGNISFNATPYMGSPAATTNFTIVAKGVNSSGATSLPDGNGAASCQVAPVAAGTGSNCPGDPTIAANTYVDVDTPDVTPQPATDPGYSTTQPGATYTQYTSQQKNVKDQIIDISGGTQNQSVLPTLVSDATYGKITIDYRPYVTGYPYDPNQAQVKYNSIYDQTDWQSSGSVDYYTCNPGDTGGGGSNICTNSYYGYADQWSCNSGDPGGGSSPFCTNYYTYTYTYSGDCSAVNTNGACTSYSCNSGGVGGGASSTCTVTVSGSYPYYGTPSHWYCSYGDYGGGGSSTCYHNYNAQPNYIWHNIRVTKDIPKPNSVSAYSMEACFKRGFKVTNVQVNGTHYDPTDEDPTTVQAGGYATADFVIPSGFPSAPNGLRNAVSVTGISTNATADYSGGCPASPSSNDFIGDKSLPDPNKNSTLANYSCDVKAPPLVAGQRVCVTYTLSPSVGLISWNGEKSGTSGSVSNSGCTNPLTNQPYANFYGLDVSAGGEFASGSNNCLGSNNTTGGPINAFVKDGNPLTRGSSAQFGALANGNISSFGTASLRPGGTPPNALSGLAFANTGGPVGNLGVVSCIPDYYGSRDSGTTPKPGNNSNVNTQTFNAGPPSDPKQIWYKSPSGLTLKSPNPNGTIDDGSRIAVFVEGDVYIEDSIKYRNTAWASVADIPSFYLVVSGNIYIGPNVTQLDGVYVAQQNGSVGGQINTCAPGLYDYTAPSLFTNCGQQLTVNGSFIAQRVKLSRTFASLRNSLGGEQPLGSGNCNLNTSRGERTAVNNNYDCAAEVFRTSPDIFIQQPAVNPSGGKSKGKYDYITTLSPVL